MKLLPSIFVNDITIKIGIKVIHAQIRISCIGYFLLADNGFDIFEVLNGEDRWEFQKRILGYYCSY